MDQGRLYGDLSWTWPIISPPDQYIEEAEKAIELIRAHARIPVKTLLHLGCGGGHLDRTLKRHVDVLGIDVSEDMLVLARAMNPGIRYRVGDMRSLRLEEAFDAVAAFDSITYMLSVDDLRAACRTAYRHLKVGGVFLTYAEETAERFRSNRTRVTTSSEGDVTITFVEHAFDSDPSDTIFETDFVYLIRRSGQLTIETDRHEGGLFPLETWLRLLQDVGFETETVTGPPEEDAIPWFVGMKGP